MKKRVGAYYLLLAVLLAGCAGSVAYRGQNRGRPAGVYYAKEMEEEWRVVGEQFEAKNYAQALEGYKNFLDKYPYGRWTPMARYFIGECYRQLKRYTQARISYRQVLDKYPGTLWADRARERLSD